MEATLLGCGSPEALTQDLMRGSCPLLATPIPNAPLLFLQRRWKRVAILFFHLKRILRELGIQL